MMKLVEITNETFPNSARGKFVGYAQSCSINPYDNMLAIRLEAAENMANALKAEKLKAKPATAILNYFNSIRNGNAPSAFLVHNFPSYPQDKLLATPRELEFGSQPKHTGKNGYVAEISMLAANTISGEVPLKMPQQHGGYPFHHLSPRYGTENIKSGLGKGLFPWHTEESWMLDNEMHLTLLCIKGGKTPTFVASAQDVCNHLEKALNEREMSMLEEDRFIFISAASLYDGTQKSIARPIIIKENNKVIAMNINGNPEKMKAADPKDVKAQAVVDKIIIALEELHQGIILKPNDFLSVDNLQNIHTRGPFHPDDMIEGQERQLIRTHAQKDSMLIQELDDLGL